MSERKVSASGGNGRIIVARVLPASNLFKALLELCEEYQIKNGFIESCVGSLRYAKILDAVKLSNSKVGFGYTEPNCLEGPLEITSIQGTVGHDENGNVVLHVHASLADERGNSYGGHLTEDGNITLLTMEVIIQELHGIDMIRTYDNESELNQLYPRKIKE